MIATAATIRPQVIENNINKREVINGGCKIINIINPYNISPTADTFILEVATYKSVFLGCTKKASSFPSIIKFDNVKTLSKKVCATP